MSTVQCPRCSSPSSGAFCPECGTHLRPDPCARCGAPPPAGARYCTACGARLAGGSPPWLPWAAAGAALVVLALAAALFLPNDEGPRPGRINLSERADAATPRAGSPPPLTGTPREQADRLFNRIMESFAAGDTAQAMRFMPMGIQAYGLAEPLDADGLYHLSLLRTLSGDAAGARATAERVLRGEPDHILALAAAAQAARAEGDAQAARGYWSRFLEALPEERGRLPEYEQHAGILPEYEAEANAALGR